MQERARVGGREKETLTYVHYQTQDWWLAESCYLAQGAQPGALLWPRWLGWGESRREVQEGRDICVYISLVAQMVKNLPAVQEKWREVKVTQSCPTLCDPMDCTVHGILHSRILEWVAFPFSRGSSQPRGRTQVSCIVGGFLYQLSHKGSLFPGSIPGSGRSPGEGNGNPLQYSCLEDSVDRGSWWATVQRVTHDWATNRIEHIYVNRLIHVFVWQKAT